MLRKLGQRAFHTFAAIREPHELVVVQRFVKEPIARANIDDGATALSAEALALMLRDARCLAKHWHPNIARIRHVDLIDGELFLASDLVDGTTLEDLFRAGKEANAKAKPNAKVDGPPLALPILVRVLVDVLTGLSALHGLRDGINAPLGTMHGALCPANVVVGRDGVARLLNPMRPRPVRVEMGSEALGYAAPESLDAPGTSDQRADVYSVGVVLWEALTGKRLYDETDPVRVLQRQRGDDLEEPNLAETPDFAGLANVAMRAISFDPALRYKNASEMASDLRRAAGSRIASGSAVAGAVVELTGDRLRARRTDLDPATSGMRRKASERAIVAIRANKTPTTSSAVITSIPIPGPDDWESPPATAREAPPSVPGDRPTVAMPEPSVAVLANAVAEVERPAREPAWAKPSAGYTTDAAPTDPSELTPGSMTDAPPAIIAPAASVPEIPRTAPIAPPVTRASPVPKPAPTVAKPAPAPARPIAKPAVPKPIAKPAVPSREPILPAPAPALDASAEADVVEAELAVEELPGPRGSAPVVVVELAPTPTTPSRSVPPQTMALVSPLTPHVPAPPQPPAPDFVAMPARWGTPSSELSVPVGRETNTPSSHPAGAVGFERTTPSITGVHTPSRRMFRVAIAIAAVAIGVAAVAFFMTSSKTSPVETASKPTPPTSSHPGTQPNATSAPEPSAAVTAPATTAISPPTPVTTATTVDTSSNGSNGTEPPATNKAPATPVVAPAASAPAPTQPTRAPSKPKKSVYDPLGI
ncbi:hypothetical protein AKJ09_08345 [Labilithrix luteola]|uniref:Protein kinase domain-containing protein n=1 Tax=Labilithrix luteola TaxID=1391654 RepID=A0A0K1Q7P0_9BACT|nr:hypothetical protein AKJ09_08345 [Labilithrix luteola]